MYAFWGRDGTGSEAPARGGWSPLDYPELEVAISGWASLQNSASIEPQGGDPGCLRQQRFLAVSGDGYKVGSAWWELWSDTSNGGCSMLQQYNGEWIFSR